MKNSILFFLFFHATLSFSQEEIELTGSIKDSLTNEAIPFVNIYLLNNKTIGTISNEDGDFSLKFGQQDTIVFSSLSYHTAYFYGEKNSNEVHIKLQKSPIILEEVVVNPNSEALRIMQKLAKNRKRNHYTKDTYYKAFVQAIAQSDNKVDLIEEYILHVEQNIVLPKFKIIKGRVKPFSEDAKRTFKNASFGTIAGMWDDYINIFTAKFLNKKKFDNYDYSLQGMAQIDNKECYHILCVEKEKNTSANIYVERNSYAIAKIQMALKDDKYSTTNRTELTYMEIGDQWYLKSSTTSFVSKNDSKSNHKRICFYSIITPEPKEGYIGLRKLIYSSLSKYKSDFKDDFWGNKNMIPLPKKVIEQL